MKRNSLVKSSAGNWKVPAPMNAETKLWLAMKAGDEEAFRVIYQKFFSKLYHYGHKCCSDKDIIKDCIQDLFVDIWNQHKNLAETDSITYYLFAALRRKIYRELDKNQVLEYNYSTQILHILNPNVEENIISEEISIGQQHKIAEAMKKLSKRQREVISLKYYHNIGNEEIANRLSIKIESTYNLISKAIHLLKKHMSQATMFSIAVRHLIDF